VTVKRIISKERINKIKEQYKYKGKKINQLSQIEKDALLEIIAKKLGLL
jgi:hypothetical protein